MGVSFETCLRRRGDVLIGRRYYVLLRRYHDAPLRCRGDVSLRHLRDVPTRRRWVFDLRRTCDVPGMYRETSLPRRYNVFLPGGKLIPELHLKQPGFTYSACGPFTKHHERIQKFRETGNLKHLHRNELDEACFAHDAAYSDGKDLIKRTIPDKILKDRAYKIARNRNYDEYQRTLASMGYKL